jgi:hypothetical protein
MTRGYKKMIPNPRVYGNLFLGRKKGNAFEFPGVRLADRKMAEPPR